jgi:hypothetical protein
MNKYSTANNATVVVVFASITATFVRVAALMVALMRGQWLRRLSHS